MGIELALSEVDMDEVGGQAKAAPGYYHAYIPDLKEDGGKKGEMQVWFQILRGTTPGQEGIEHREQLSRQPTKWPIRKMTALAIACGLTSKEELDRMKADNQRPEIDFTQCIGRQVCLHLEQSTGSDGNTYIGLHFDEIWHPFDKRAARVPLSAEWLKAGGYVLPEGRPIDGVTANANTTPKPQGTGKTTGLERPAPGTPAQQSVADNVLADVLG